MGLDKDFFTGQIYKAMDVLMMRSPEKTSYGILLGTAITGIKNCLVKTLEGNVQIFFENLNNLTTFIIGILILRVPIVFQTEKINEEKYAEFNTNMKMINESGLSREEKSKLCKEAVSIELEVYKMKLERGEETSNKIAINE